MSVADQKRREHRRSRAASAKRSRSSSQALLIALVFRTFLFHPFNIPSGSMEPTLLVGDYLFVSKFAYGYSQLLLPLHPPASSRGVSGKACPSAATSRSSGRRASRTTDYIKRVIGLPGDRIQMRDGALYINGEAVQRERVGDCQGEGSIRRAGHDRTSTARRCRTA